MIQRELIAKEDAGCAPGPSNLNAVPGEANFNSGFILFLNRNFKADLYAPPLQTLM